MSDRLPIPVSGLSQVLRRALQSHDENTHTAMPAQVLTYTASTKKVNVQPVVDFDLLVEGQPVPQKLPIIYNVPVVFPGGAGFGLQWDLKAGDGVLLVFSECSIDAWKSGAGGETDPQDSRRFALSDAIAIPGLFAFGNPGLVMGAGKNGMAQSTGAYAYFDAAGLYHLGSASESFLTALTQLYTALSAVASALGSASSFANVAAAGSALGIAVSAAQVALDEVLGT